MNWVQTAGMITVGFNLVGIALTAVRLIRGPYLPDRIAALDCMSILFVTLLGALCITTDRHVLLDVAIILAVVSFLSTVGFARYLEKSLNQ